MFITRNPGQTLELCYVAQKVRPSNIDEPKTDYKPSMGERWAITWDETKQRIVSIPPERHDVTETKRGRATTTGRIANWIVQGRILAAAEKQYAVRANFLRFLYDPECPMPVRAAVSRWAHERMLLLVPVDDKRIAHKRERIKDSDISDALLLQFSQMIRGGGERYTETQLCYYLGFGSLSDANYARDYRKIAATFMLQLQDFEGVAMRPVAKVINDIFNDKGVSVATQYHHKDKDAKAAPATNYAAPRHAKTLTMRRRVEL